MMEEDKLIFIVSQPRAGSTFLQNLLSNNNLVNTTSEHWLMLNFANQLNPKIITATFDNNLSSDAFVTTFKEKVGEELYSKKLKDFILSLYQPLLEDHSYVLDKTPRYWEILEEIKSMFPKSRIIILKRDPISVLKSIINTWNKTTIKSLKDYQRDLVLGPKVLHDFSLKYKNDPNVMTVRYESLLEDLSSGVQAIYSWLDIPFQVQNLNIEHNHKIRGKYGDPFQNSNKSYEKTKSKVVDLIEGDLMLKSFIKAYENFLGKTFLNEYTGRDLSIDKLKKDEFKDFFNIESTISTNIRLQNEITHIKKSTSYRCARLLSSPIRFFKGL
jgi:hypothetical protein